MLSKNIIGKGPEVYYDKLFRQTIEDHLEHLRSGQMVTIAIDNNMAETFNGDFSGLLTELNVPIEQHWIYMRVCGMTSFDEYRSDRTVLQVPTEEDIKAIVRVFRTQYKKDSK